LKRRYGTLTGQTFLFSLTGDFRRVLISSFPLNGVWLLIVDSHLRLAEYGRLRIDLFSIAPAGFFVPLLP
jgi:hypothetical protein